MTTHLLSSLAADIAAIEMLASAMKLKVEALHVPEPAAPEVPATANQISIDVLVEVISLELSGFAKGRRNYKTAEFCEHCRPLLPLGTADVALDSDNQPLWRDRFFRFHNKLAARRGFKRTGPGTWAAPAGGK
jgi:hypothetical protein